MTRWESGLLRVLAVVGIALAILAAILFIAMMVIWTLVQRV